MARRFTQCEVATLIEAAVAPLQAKISRLEAKVADLQAKADELESENARLKKNSSTSSKPPSSDILPGEVTKAVGVRLSALIGYQQGACHMSYICIERFLDDVLHLKLCRGYLVKVVQKMSASLAAGYPPRLRPSRGGRLA